MLTHHYFVIVVSVTLGRLSNCLQQSDLDYIGKNLQVRYKVVNNLNGNNENFEARITLTNMGDQAIGQDSWEIFLHSLFIIEPDHLPTPDGYEVSGTGLKFFHVTGSLFKMAPTSNFPDLEPMGGSVVINIVISFWSVSKSDVMPRWYVASSGFEPVLIASTIDDFVDDFTSEQQYKRYAGDLYQPFTPEQRYSRYNSYDSRAQPKLIIPTPLVIEGNESDIVKIDSTWKIQCIKNYTKVCDFLSDAFMLDVITTDDITTNVIIITCDEVELPDVNVQHEEAYSLQFENDSITITAPQPVGAFYASQTLISLYENGQTSVPRLNIKDAPRFGYRGMHLDVARNFVEKGDVIMLLRTMAQYKLNKFHFHLTDDEGWRLQLAFCPELTNVGGQRSHADSEDETLFPQLGSGPDSGTSGSGFYSREDYQEILQVAEDNFIKVIPEFDMPGHAYAAIKSNLAYYNRLMADDPSKAEEVLISDLNDTSRHLSLQLFPNNVVNPCINGTYEFIANVTSEVIDMHQGIQELTVFHLGGDEVPNAWDASPRCDEFMKDKDFPSNLDELSHYFVKEASRSARGVSSNSIVIALWEDGAISENEDPYPKNSLSDDDVIAYAWQNVWEWGVSNRAYKLANAGYKVVLSPSTHLYFDQPNEPDPEEGGLYWASRYTDNKKAFSFMPEDLYSNADAKRTGETYTETMMCKDFICEPLKHPENIIGIQGHLWTETVRSQDRFHYMIFPRMLSLAERAWHKASWESTATTDVNELSRDEDWAQFAASLGQRELPRLEKKGIKYRIPLPGAVVKDDVVLVGCEFPDLPIRFRKEGRAWEEGMCGDELSIAKGETVEIETKSTVGSRYSRSIRVNASTHVKGSPILLLIAGLLLNRLLI